MGTGLLALWQYALRADALKILPHLYRAVFTVALLMCLFFVQVMSLTSVLGAPGLTAFKAIVGMNFLAIALAAVFQFTTVVTEEKEEGTLVLLELAGINRLGLLLGKSTAQLFAAGMLLVLQLPFAFLAITLGGVTTRQILAAYVALLAFLVLAANLALLCSVLCRRSSAAAALMAVLVILVCILPSLAGPTLLAGAGGGATTATSDGGLEWIIVAVISVFYEHSIVHRLATISTTNFAEPIVSAQVASNIGLGVLLFLGSWGIFGRFSHTRIDAASFSQAPALRRIFGTRFGRVWKRPLVWKEFYFLGGGPAAMLVKGAAYGVLVAAIVVPNSINQDFYGPDETVYWLIGTMGVLLGIEAGYMISRVFHDEVRNNTLSGIAQTRITTYQVVLDKELGCLAALAPGILAMFVGGLFCPVGGEKVFVLFFSPVTWVGLSAVGFAVHLMILLTLELKSKLLAFLMAAGGCFNMFPLVLGVGLLAMPYWAHLLFLPVAAVTIGMLVWMQLAIARSLEWLSAEH